MKFLITESPTPATMDAYLKLFEQYHVHDIIRVCSLLYDESIFTQTGFTIHNLEYPDGHSPSKEIIRKWNLIVKASIKKGSTIAIHCIAGYISCYECYELSYT